MSCGPAVSRFLWWLADSSAQILESSECEAVRGDLAESGETGGQALRHVLGLVIRRQASVWMDWRPWLTLLGLVVPLGMLLSVISRRMAAMSSVYIWMYANNWDPGLFGYRGFWYQFADTFAEIFRMYLSLACSSWTSGFVLGSASRSIIRVNSFLFSLMLAFGVLLGAPLYIVYYQHYLHRTIGFPIFARSHYDPVNALTFYRVMFPLIVQAVLVLLPSLRGMRDGARAVRLPSTVPHDVRDHGNRSPGRARDAEPGNMGFSEAIRTSRELVGRLARTCAATLGLLATCVRARNLSHTTLARWRGSLSLRPAIGVDPDGRNP